MKCRIKKSYWQQDITKLAYAGAILRGVLLLLAISYLFYGTFWCVFLLSPYLIRYIKSWKKQTISKKKQLFQQQFKDAIQSISAALNVGYSVENAVREAKKDLQLIYRDEDMILREFTYMVHQLDMNLPLEEVLQQFASRTEEEDVHTFVTVFAMAKRSGGDMISIIRNAVTRIGEKMDVKREIETTMAAKKLEFRIMSIIPFAMICYLKLSFSEFMSVLYGNPVGVVVMTISLAIYVASYEIGKKIVEIEV